VAFFDSANHSRPYIIVEFEVWGNAIESVKYQRQARITNQCTSHSPFNPPPENPWL